MKKCKIRIVKALEGVFAKYQPEVGTVYDADYVQRKRDNWSAFCVITVKDKQIIVRRGEFELVGE